MDAAPALQPACNISIDIVTASSAELVSHVKKSKGKRRKKKKVVKKKDYTRTETPELLHAISTVLETKPYLIQDAAALKTALELRFFDLKPTYSIIKKVATRLVEKQRAERKAEAAARTQVITKDCETLRTAIESILSESVALDTTALKTQLLAPPHFIKINWKLLEEVRAAMGPPPGMTAPKLDRSNGSTHKLRNPRSISGMDWTKVTGISASSSGSVGVLFVEFPDGVVVLKSSDKNFSETLGMVLSAKLGIPTVKCRVVYMKPEGELMADSLNKFVSHFPERVDEPLRMRDRIAKVFARPQVLVLELVCAAITMDELQSLHTKPSLLASQHGVHVPSHVLLSATQRVFDPTLEHGRRRLQELGQILALDVFTNNCDRIPTVFDNAGNPGNVLFSFGAATDRAQVIAVDQDVTVVNPNTKASAVRENLNRITTRASAFAAEVAACCAARESKGASSNSAPTLKILDSVRTYVTPFTLHDFGAEGVYWVAVGAREAIDRLSCLGDEAVDTLVSEVAAMCKVISPMWTRMSQAPFTPFFALMREAFRRGLEGGSGDKKTGGETISDETTGDDTAKCKGE